MRVSVYRVFCLGRNVCLTFVISFICIALGLNTYSTSALTYQTSTDVKFTFQPTLTVTVSDDLVISDLAPGMFSDSNAAQVTVSANNAYGFSLSATVGDTNNSSSELRHSTYASSGDPIFSSIATDANLARATFSSDSTYDNKWGLAVSSDGTTWGNYNGLPVTGGENALGLLSSSYTPTNGTASKYVRIGARAGVGQASGTYTNTINFTAVATPGPMSLEEAFELAGKTKYLGYYKMQDFADGEICENAELPGTKLRVIDVRDDKLYWIAKLPDGHCWMTDNLNLTGGILLSSETTDFESTYTLPTDNGWQIDGRLPESSYQGFYYEDPNYDDNYAYIYNSNSTICGANAPCYSYYSWDVATLGSGRSISTDNTDAPYSICPKGWHLPSTYNGTNSTSDYRRLSISYGANDLAMTYDSATTPTGATLYGRIGPNTFPDFQLTGLFFDNGYQYQTYGLYWTATSYSTDFQAYNILFDADNFYFTDVTRRFGGLGVRCVH